MFLIRALIARLLYTEKYCIHVQKLQIKILATVFNAIANKLVLRIVIKSINFSKIMTTNGMVSD